MGERALSPVIGHCMSLSHKKMAAKMAEPLQKTHVIPHAWLLHSSMIRFKNQVKCSIKTLT